MNQSQQNETSPAGGNTDMPRGGISADPGHVWETLRSEALRVAAEEPALRHLLDGVILSRGSLAAALSAHLARRMAREDMPQDVIDELCLKVFANHPHIVRHLTRDMLAMLERDAACFSLLEPLLFFKGFLALAGYRVSHQLWHDGRRWLALYLQSVVSESFAVDIHPAARIGCGIFLDHATSIVVGETAIIEDDVSILHEVTLGGTGKMAGERHPVIRSGVLLGAGAKILGRVEIGTGAKVGAGSVVLNDVPPHTTVAGVPAVIVGTSIEQNPAIEMNHNLNCSEEP